MKLTCGVFLFGLRGIRFSGKFRFFPRAMLKACLEVCEMMFDLFRFDAVLFSEFVPARCSCFFSFSQSAYLSVSRQTCFRVLL